MPATRLPPAAIATSHSKSRPGIRGVSNGMIWKKNTILARGSQMGKSTYVAGRAGQGLGLGLQEGAACG